jgi:hypothetical protein
MDKDPKLPRNSLDAWWISGGIDTFLKNVRDPKLPRNSWDSWWIPGRIDTCSKILRDSNYPGIPGVQ